MKIFILICVLFATETLADKKTTESVAVFVANEYIQRLKAEDSEYKTLIHDILHEKRYEVFAALELNRIGQQYISARYVFGGNISLENTPNDAFSKKLGIDRDSLEKELRVLSEKNRKENTFKHMDNDTLENLSILIKYLDKVVSNERNSR